MKIFKRLTPRSRQYSNQQSILTSSFTYAGLSLMAIFVVGIMVSFIIYKSGIVSALGNGRFNWNIYNQIGSYGGDFRSIGVLSVAAMILIFASFILRMVWLFRIHTASKTFIGFVYATFIIAQGIGFGALFATWNSYELIGIIGITGAIFGAMALVGYYSKNLTGLLPFLMAGTIALMVMSLINLIMFLTGVYNDTFMFILLTLSGLLVLGYIAFDVWWIKKTSQVYEDGLLDRDDRFRIVAFLGFQLLTDFIWLFWVVIRFYSRMRN